MMKRIGRNIWEDKEGNEYIKIHGKCYRIYNRGNGFTANPKEIKKSILHPRQYKFEKITDEILEYIFIGLVIMSLLLIIIYILL